MIEKLNITNKRKGKDKTPEDFKEVVSSPTSPIDIPKQQVLETIIENQWEIPYSDLEFLELIGSGMYGEVYRGRLWGTDVAIKKLKETDAETNDQVLSDLKKEVKILSELRHPNVVLYIGACTKAPNICIVTEWCSNGNLHELLHNSEAHLDVQSITQLAMGIAQGMNYLHSLERKIIHRDLKSHNLLISDNLTVKVADFGLSHKRRKAEKEFLMTDSPAGHYGILGTPEWMAPEVMTGNAYSEKIDVYSYGIVLTELLTRQMPFRDQYTIQSYTDVLDAVLDDGAMPTIPEWSGTHMKSLITRCLSRNPAERPSFMQIINHIRSFYQAPAERDSFRYFRDYDFPRLLYMLLKQERRIVCLAASEISDVLPNSKDASPSANGRKMLQIFSDKRTLSVMIVSLTSLVNSYSRKLMYEPMESAVADNASSLIVLKTLKALSKILLHSGKSERSFVREILQEEGGFRSLLLLLSSSDEKLERASKEAVSLLMQDLDLKEQIRMFDINYQDISAHDLNGLSYVSRMMEEELQDIRHQIANLETLFEQKKSLQTRIEIASKVMQAEYKKRGADSTLSVRPRRSIAGLSLPISQTLISELTDSDEVPLSFIEYFGDFKRIYCGYCVCGYVGSIQECDVLKVRFVALSGDVIRLYERSDCDPSDPIELVYITTAVGVPVSLEISSVESEASFLKLTNGQSRNFVICTKGRERTLRWAHIIDPNQYAPPISNQIDSSISHRLSIQQIQEATSTNDLIQGSDIEIQHQMLVGLNLSSILEKNVSLSAEFVEYFGGDTCVLGGYLAVKMSSAFPWRTAFCVLMKWREIKLYDTATDDPDDPWGVIQMDDQDDPSIMVIPNRKSQEDLSPSLEEFKRDHVSNGTTWKERAFGLHNSKFSYLFCARDQDERLKWFTAFESANRF